MSLNNTRHCEFLDHMYLNELEIRDDTYTLMSASYFDLYLPINEEDD